VQCFKKPAQPGCFFACGKVGVLRIAQPQGLARGGAQSDGASTKIVSNVDWLYSYDKNSISLKLEKQF
jgi:hypothetical protein